MQDRETLECFERLRILRVRSLPLVPDESRKAHHDDPCFFSLDLIKPKALADFLEEDSFNDAGKSQHARSQPDRSTRSLSR